MSNFKGTSRRGFEIEDEGETKEGEERKGGGKKGEEKERKNQDEQDERDERDERDEQDEQDDDATHVEVEELKGPQNFQQKTWPTNIRP